MKPHPVATPVNRLLLLSNAAVDRLLGKADVAVLAAILVHVNRETGRAWPGVAKLVKHTSLARRTVLRSMQVLESLGYLDVERRQYKSNVFIPPLVVSEGGDEYGTSDESGTSRLVTQESPGSDKSVPGLVTNSSATGDESGTQNSAKNSATEPRERTPAFSASPRKSGGREQKRFSAADSFYGKTYRGDPDDRFPAFLRPNAEDLAE